ncbi:MAG: hypothetical protein GF387_01505 [Candidatus Portnoybacteria bacterium]|nr:hypothetical protein [Candidatus Portnoybacteria bacterium]
MKMKRFTILFLLALLIVPLLAFAQADPQNTICRVLQYTKTIIAAVGFGIAIIILIIGGIRYMTSGGDEEKAGSARKQIVNALIGIVIVFAAVFIIALVQGFLMKADIPIGTDPCNII